MNKADLIELIAQDAGISKAAADKAINAFMSGVTESLRRGKDVTLMGFGSFSVSNHKARRGYNPQTKEIIRIPAKKSVRFTVGSKLKAALNRKKRG